MIFGQTYYQKIYLKRFIFIYSIIHLLHSPHLRDHRFNTIESALPGNASTQITILLADVFFGKKSFDIIFLYIPILHFDPPPFPVWPTIPPGIMTRTNEQI